MFPNQNAPVSNPPNNQERANMIMEYMKSIGYKESDIKAAIDAVGTNEDRVLDHLFAHASLDQAQMKMDKEATRKAFVDDMVASGLDRRMVEAAVDQVGMDPNNVQLFIAQNMSENDLIEKAKLKSLAGNSQNDEEMQMQQAIAASLMPQGYGGAFGSTLSSSSFSPSEQEKERVPGMPTGLFNAGAICYFNTFIQTYFAIPPIRKYILEMDGDLIDMLTSDMKENSDHFKADDCLKSTVEPKDYTDNDKKYLLYEFLRKLHDLFAEMQLTNRSAIQSKTLLKVFLKASGRELEQVSHQQDIGEYGSLFQELLVKAMNVYADISGTPCDEIVGMWKGSQKGVTTWEAQPGCPRSTETKSEFTELMVRPSEISDSFYRVMVMSLTYYVNITVGGRSVDATQVTWLENLPEMLFIQENRTSINDCGEQIKNNNPLEIPPQIYLDRFLYQHKSAISALRLDEETQYSQISHLQSQKLSLTNYKGRGFSLTAALRSSIDAIADSPADHDKALVLAALAAYEREAAERLQALEGQEAEAKEKLHAAYDDPRFKNEPYALFGVWLHAGTMQFGHYRAYLRNVGGGGSEENNAGGRERKWLQFNDERVSWVDEEVVLREARGEDSLNAAYVVYVKEAKLREWERMVNESDGNVFLNIPESTTEKALKKNMDVEKGSPDVPTKRIKSE